MKCIGMAHVGILKRVSNSDPNCDPVCMYNNCPLLDKS